ncbi:GGDEF domain-containing protein [Rhodococcoides kyotonense]|uniref:Diguanylate cyclase (GGDEF) domain-containing protein n=1 Tax=Rhodococcoides kyotonense TaxID=398843 RepID=A0A239KB12_9NOCA|nr:GGDEF domain-containing protein [Rhodococcus kyotonensis]SNT14863.1 diguanylate cyclase (GGDEF) domain-containing protein [Rhodococcus kyotonensis]
MIRPKFDEAGITLLVFVIGTTLLYAAAGSASWSEHGTFGRIAVSISVMCGIAAVVVLVRSRPPSPKRTIGTVTFLAIVALTASFSTSATLPAFLICVQAAIFLGMHIGAFWSERNASIWVAALAVSAVSGAAAGPFDSSFVSYVLVALGIVGATEVFGVFARRMRYSATHDTLTGLHNRFGFESKVEKMLPACASRGLSVSVAVLDLDNFKQINDEYGHIAGDVLLSRVSKAWKAELGRRDVLGRLGGDEFVLFMPGVLEAEAWQIVERLRRAHRAEWSVGLVCMPAARRWIDIYRAADADLYRAKRSRPRAQKASRSEPPDTGESEWRIAR